MEQRRPGRSWLRLAAAGVLLAGAAGVVACGDDDEDSGGGATPAATQAATPAPKDDPAAVAAVETAMRNVTDNWNANDKDAFLAGFTDAGLVSIFGDDGQTVDEVKADLEFFFGSTPITNVTIANTKVSGSSATTESQFAIFGAYQKNTEHFVKEGGAWKIDSETALLVDVPEGVKIVRVEVIEFAFGVDTSAIADGNVAFELSNVGKQHHEMVITSIPADANIDDLIQQFVDSPDRDVPGVVFVGQTEAAPGAKANIVFTEPLAPGRYVMACFVPDETEGENGTPHALKGMFKEFTVK